MAGIRRFLRMLREGPAPTPCQIERLESERGFRLSGELDIFSVESVREALAPELHGTLVLDIAGVEFMDDSGLGLLVGCVKRLRQSGGTLVLRDPASQIRRVFEVTGIERLPGTIEP
jgi:anti-sigma B factor antagonist